MKKSNLVITSLLIMVVLFTIGGCTKTTTKTTTNPPNTTTQSTTTQNTTTQTSGLPLVLLKSPTVSTMYPAYGDTDVPVNFLITANFDSAMSPSTINVNTFTLWQGTTPVPGLVNYYGMTAIFDPSADLQINTTYTVKITTDVTDTTGVHMQNNFIWSFTTGAADTVSPTVIYTNPADGDDNVPTNNVITVSFSEPMDPSTINTSTFTLMQGTTQINGTVNFDGVRTATFNPANDLTPNTIYTATITTGVTCSAGHPMAQNYVLGFTTGAPQTTVPMVISTIPSSSATGVPINNSITATFSEGIDPMTITTGTFGLWQGTTLIPGTVEYDGVSSAVFTPLLDLTINTTYYAKITADVTDLAGNHMSADFIWSFTTGAADTTIPSVVSTSPADGDKNVTANSAIKVTFSEAIDPTSINIILMQGTDIVPITIGWNDTGKVVTITPADVLTSNTIYTVYISGGTDLAGIGTVSDTWSFTTSP